MSAIVYTIPSANVANGLVGISTINSLISSGNPNLLTANQAQAMANVQTFYQSIPGGVVNYTFNEQMLTDFTVFGSAVNNLANNGPTLTYSQAVAAAGTINGVPTGGLNAFPIGANTVVFIDSYFIVEAPGTGAFFISNSNDGTTWNVLATGTAEANPDNTVAVENLNGELVCFGQQTIQYFADQGDPPQVFVPIQGATQQYGLAAIYSTAPFQGTIAFLGQNRQGTCQVMVLQGYQPVAISTPDIDNLINSFYYVNDAMASSFTVDGHEMYEITFPIAGYSFLYDALTQVWSTVQSGLQDGGRHNIQFITTFNYNNFASDYLSGNVYLLDINNNTENGKPLKRQVVSRHIYDQGNSFGIDEIFLDMDTGEGLQVGQGSDPKLMMQISKDNGRTWGNERVASLGKVGQYGGPRVVFRRLGSSRLGFVFKFTLTDPVPFIASSASAVVRGGTEDQQ